MPAKKKKAVKKFGARYGKKVKDNWAKVEEKQRKKQKCPFCGKPGLKRLSKGIWKCPKCGRKFASDIYYLKS